jgi:carbonic anhydrase
MIDELLANNAAYAANFDRGDLPRAPARGLAILACMDARLDVFGALGLHEGDAQVIRNAGGLVTDDAIRSLAISQHFIGTEEIIVIHHTDCAALNFDDESFKRSLYEETGVEPRWSAETFCDLEESLRRSVAQIKSSPFIPRKDSVRGLLYEVETGRLREVR